jgi:RND superfamily putative drug exporter
MTWFNTDRLREVDIERMTAAIVMGSVRRRRLVTGSWFVAVIGLAILAITFGGNTGNDYGVPNSDSAAAVDLLRRIDVDGGGASAQIIFSIDRGDVFQPAVRPVIEHVVADVKQRPHVASVSDPYSAGGISSNHRAALATVLYDEPVENLSQADANYLQEATGYARNAGIGAEVGGQLMTETTSRGSGWAEAIGFGAALVVLLVVFGNATAAAICLAVAAVAVGCGLAILICLSAIMTVPSTAPSLASMIGIGVAIDYALFFVSRYRANVRMGMTEWTGMANAATTAGKSVAIAGGTVVIALGGLLVADLPPVSAMAYGAGLVVIVAVTAALTLLPALLAIAGDRAYRVHPAFDSLAIGGARAEGRWRRWVGTVVAKPWQFLIAGLLMIAILALPIWWMRLGQLDAGADAPSTTQRRAYDLVAENFTPGTSSPLLVVVTPSANSLESPPSREVLTATDSLRSSLTSDPRVARIETGSISNNVGYFAVMPVESAQSKTTVNLVNSIRSASTGGVVVHVGGETAAYIDFTARIYERLVGFIGLILVLSVVILSLVFKAPIVAFKAAFLNALSIGASLGVIVALFQFGWGSPVLVSDGGWPIPSFVPLLVFALVFGLSMDYEIFILSRVREEFIGAGLTDANRANCVAVIGGVSKSAQVIAPAALIMIAVFVGFALDPDGNIRIIGVALAVAILLDATIIRLAIIPAAMTLLGGYNWWPIQKSGAARVGNT